MLHHDLLDHRTHQHLFFYRTVLRQSCGSTRHGSPLLPGTSAPHSLCLAQASLPGSGRRCLRASASALPASRLDLVQGTAQKIHLQHLVGQSLLQLLHFRCQRLLPPPVRSQHLRIQPLLPPRQSAIDPLPTPMPLPLISLRPVPSHSRPAKLQSAFLGPFYIRHSQLLSCSVGILSLSHFGVQHSSEVMCCLCFLSDLILRKPLKNNRLT